MCPDKTQVQYKTIRGLFWLCFSCAKLKGHMLIATKYDGINNIDRSKYHDCQCEHISHCKD